MFGRILIFLITFSSLNCLAQQTTVAGGELKKFSQDELRSDLFLLKNILEANHPSLYWYTSREKLDSIYSATLTSINDSMNEVEFKNYRGEPGCFPSMAVMPASSLTPSRDTSALMAMADSFPTNWSAIISGLTIKIFSDSIPFIGLLSLIRQDNEQIPSLKIFFPCQRNHGQKKFQPTRYLV